MGLDPELDDFIIGDECGGCSGTIFLDGTPKWVEIVFKDIVACPGAPAPPNGSHLLPQAFPCTWFIPFGATGSIFWDFSTGDSVAGAGDGTWSFFLGSNILLCKTDFTNFLTCNGGAPKGGTGGTAEIFWGPTIHP